MRKPIHRPLGKGLMTCFYLALFLPFGSLLAQQCPVILNCQSPPAYCDESTNDPFLWNYGPYTYSQTIGYQDLHEGEVDLNLKFKGCNQGGISSISYILYLDLDNDGLQETVLTSGSPPPAGKVMANNSFNPGFAGGDTVQFDGRYLPDSLLYRFALEIAYSGDTTIGWVRFNTNAEPYSFVPVILPEGRHRIEWRAVQNGVERFCDRNFKVKDCKKPVIVCNPTLPVYVDASQNVMMPLLSALQSVSDNISPDTQLVLGIRRAGAGSGFPFSAPGIPQDTVMFNCQMTENQSIELWVKDRADNLEHCTATVLVYDTAGFCPFVPFPSICARTYWNEENIRDVTFSTGWTPMNQPPVMNSLELGQYGCSELISLPPSNSFTLQASKDAVPLNGVTTYDLVLISKHILALEPFDAGWKLVAADANMSHSVTTFDIVEIRKLILGLSSKFPNGTPSWRFFVDTCSTWGSPYFGNCPSAYTLPVQAISAYPPQLSFSGIKIGDVNGSAASIDTLQGISTNRGEAIVLEMPDVQLIEGESMDIPIRATTTGAWEGMQCSFAFDPAMLELEALLPGENLAFTSENWAIPEPGVLNLSWSEAFSKVVAPGDILFYLRVKASQTIPASRILSLQPNAPLQAEMYEKDGQTHPLSLRFAAAEKQAAQDQSLIFAPVPNPTTGAARIAVRLRATENISLELFDVSGNLIFQQQAEHAAGAHLLEIPDRAIFRPGVYFWRVVAGTLTQSGKLIRQ